ncbi:MAG: M20/M25/M40 family metallo-hydrolase [Solirubrobacteraceae bacterium]|nr:M20/M25/M40 family metallo-hydrolase [Solirubrobacteraceae bacterium]
MALTLAFVPAASADHDPMKTSEDLREDVKVSGIRAHLQALQNIATMNNGTRASGTPGYDASAAYVMRRLERAGYEPEQTVFTFKAFDVLSPAVFERVSPNPRAFVNPDEFQIMSYSGSGDVTAALQPIDVVLPPGAAANSNTSGCEAADFAGFTRGNVALMQRGTCPFAQKVENAQAAGASAAVVFNEGQPGRDDTLAGTLGEDTTATIPAIGTSFAIGNELAATPGTVVHVATSTKITPTTTSNVIADLAPRRPRGAGKVVLVGAHLDSVPEGPGINDNGSGSGTILEIAEEMARNRPSRNPVRFAFWGAEEAGLVGATRYVAGLSDEEGARIGLNLNFDMLASPNFIRLVYDGDGSAFGLAGPSGSDDIEHVFEEYFAAKGLAADPTAFDGRSDYKPFIDVGIPAGGLFSGAENVKTVEQQERHGGVAGEPFDRCYHQACDTISNINYVGLRQLSQAATHATAVFAARKEAVGASTAATRKRSGARSARSSTRLGHHNQR